MLYGKEHELFVFLQREVIVLGDHASSECLSVTPSIAKNKCAHLINGLGIVDVDAFNIAGPQQVVLSGEATARYMPFFVRHDIATSSNRETSRFPFKKFDRIYVTAQVQAHGRVTSLMPSLELVAIHKDLHTDRIFIRIGNEPKAVACTGANLALGPSQPQLALRSSARNSRSQSTIYMPALETEMAGPTMTDEKYRSLTKGQRVAYWSIVAAVAAFLAYMLFFYRQ